MTFPDLTRASLRHYWRSHVAVGLGVATAVAVLAGSLLVGASVRRSLEDITLGRLGRTTAVVASGTPFDESLHSRIASELGTHPGGPVSAPMLILSGAVTHASSDRTAAGIAVYGVDPRFFAFHGAAAPALENGAAWLSPALAKELGARPGEAVIVRVARPSDVPADSLHGRRDRVARSMRLGVAGELAPAAMGEFALSPGQAPVRAVFMPLARLQQDVAQLGRVNTVLISAVADVAATGESALVREAVRTSASAGDLGVRVRVLEGDAILTIDSPSGLLTDTAVAAARAAAAQQSFEVTPVFTWLANRIIAGDRVVPYSLVTAIGTDAAGDLDIARALAADPSPSTDDAPPIVLNDWTAADLEVARGDRVELEFYRYTDAGQLITERAAFRVRAVVPMRGLAADRHLAPDYPGITEAKNVADWDPPFPVDLSIVRPRDDAYWDTYGTTPKAFISIETGQRLWATRHGRVTSLRARPHSGAALDPASAASTLEGQIASAIDPFQSGLSVVDVRRQNLAASSGSTDFGAYFSYFSFFLMVSALLLTAMFFRLSVEQRSNQVGLLRAAGFSLRDVRKMFLAESFVVTSAGAVAGVVLAIGWAGLMMLGLRTWWIGAVGTSALRLHVDAASLAIGMAGAALAAVLSIIVSVRALRRSSPRQLLTGAAHIGGVSRSRVSVAAAAAAIIGAVALVASSLAGVVPAAAAFFGAGGLALIGGLALFRIWLFTQRPFGRVLSGAGAVMRLGAANAAWRPGRSVSSAALVASAVFLLVAVDTFRKSSSPAAVAAGTGGFALFAESSAPIIDDPSSPSGRVALVLQDDVNDPLWSGVTVVPARLRPGDDAGCLNLYRPTRPRLLGIDPSALVESGFRFSSAIGTESVGQETWRLLGPPDADGIVPAIADATSLQYALHASVGDVITIDADSARPIRLRIVAALADSMLQSEIVISDRSFTALFPDQAGFRVLLVRAAGDDPGRLDALTRAIEGRLESLGIDVRLSADRLEEYHRIENTYISTFQMLGGLGLVLGTIGLAAITARSVIERRRELALMAASGYSMRQLQILVAAEQLTLLSAGMAIGLVAAAVAIAPVLGTSIGWPRMPVLWLLVVAGTGIASAAWSTRSLGRLPLLASLRSE